MKTDWKTTVRTLLAPIQTEENPFAQIESITRTITQDVKRLEQTVRDLEMALNENEAISFLIQQPHSEEVVRDYLHDLLDSLRKAKPAAPTKSEGSVPTKKNLLIAVDFDGTIVEHKFPEIGPPLPGAFETLRAMLAAGHRLILFTCREDEMDASGRRYLTEAIQFCNERGVKFVSANETLSNDDFRPQGGRKVYADLYIDDRNLGGFPGWEKIKKAVLG